eukprot:994277-Rhodomonas_salina.1
MHLTLKSVVFVTIAFVCTMPLGIGAGILLLVHSGYDAESSDQLWLQGDPPRVQPARQLRTTFEQMRALEAVSGGILLYIALVHFIAGPSRFPTLPPFLSF